MPARRRAHPVVRPEVYPVGLPGEPAVYESGDGPCPQEAQALERLGRFDEATAAGCEAIQKESWRTFFILSRIEAKRGNARPALAAYQRAKQLKRYEGVFAS